MTKKNLVWGRQTVYHVDQDNPFSKMMTASLLKVLTKRPLVEVPKAVDFGISYTPLDSDKKQ